MSFIVFLILCTCRLCTNVEEIVDMSDKCQPSTVQSMVSDIAQVSEQLHKTKLEKSKNITLTKKKKATLLQEINIVIKRADKHLASLKKAIVAELDTQQIDIEKEISRDMKAADDLINACDKHKSDLTSSCDEKHLFINEKLGRLFLADAAGFLKNANLQKQHSLKFVPNDHLFDAIKKSKNAGKIMKNDAKSSTKSKAELEKNYTVASIKETSMKIKSDENNCSVNGICQLPDGTILLIDMYNNKLKRLNDRLKVKDFLDLKSHPIGLCSVSSSEVAVRMKETIQFVSVGQTLSYQRDVTIIHPTSAMFGMACCTNLLWIPADKSVNIYALSGILVRKIDTDSQGKRIFPVSNPTNIVVSNDETKVYVAAGGDRVVVFSSNGLLTAELRDNRLDHSCSVCITEDNNLLVSGFYSKNVIMFNGEGRSLGELVKRDDTLPASNPCLLLYDRHKCRLIIGYQCESKVQIIQLNK